MRCESVKFLTFAARIFQLESTETRLVCVLTEGSVTVSVCHSIEYSRV